MAEDPILRYRSHYEAEIHQHYRTCRTQLTQLLRNELTRSEINSEQFSTSIRQVLNIAGNQTVSSSWRHLDYIYKTGVSHALNQLDTTGAKNLIAEYDKGDQEITDQLIEEVRHQMTKKDEDILSGVIKTVGKKKPVTIAIKDVQTYLISTVTPDIVSMIQTAASRAYNEALFSRISRFGTYKQWVFVSDKCNADYHLPMEGVTIPVEDQFEIPSFLESKTKEIPGTTMRYPQDSSSKPHPLHLEDCRCYIRGVFRDPR